VKVISSSSTTWSAPIVRESCRVSVSRRFEVARRELVHDETAGLVDSLGPYPRPWMPDRERGALNVPGA
jgi:hypothetical protein